MFFYEYYSLMDKWIDVLKIDVILIYVYILLERINMVLDIFRYKKWVFSI